VQGPAGAKAAKLGEILVAEGKIMPEQLEHDLALQKNDRREIGKILLALGYINRIDRSGRTSRSTSHSRASRSSRRWLPA
jgi:hypothetical protein